MNSFAERLKDLRIERGMSQEVLAKALGTGNSTISLWENGQREPSMSSLILCAKFFKVSIDYLTGLED